MENLKSQFIQIIQDAIGDDLFCYIINSSNFKDKEIDFKFDKINEVKFLKIEDLTGQDKAWPNQAMSNNYVLFEYDNQLIYGIFKIQVYGVHFIALSANNEKEIINTLKNNNKKFEKLLEEKDPFFKEKSIIYMEAYFLNAQTSNEIQNNRKLKI